MSLTATVQAVRKLSKGLFGCYKVAGKRYAGKIEFSAGLEPILYKGFIAEVTQEPTKTVVTKIVRKLK